MSNATNLENGAVTISALDPACMHAVFRHLPARCLARASCVNREWSAIAADEALWHHAYLALDTAAFVKNAAQQLDAIVAGGVCPAVPSFNSHLSRFHVLL